MPSIPWNMHMVDENEYLARWMKAGKVFIFGSYLYVRIAAYDAR